MHVYVRFTKLVLSLRVTTYDLRQVTSPIMEVKRYYIVSYIFYIINPTAQKLIRVAQWVKSLDLTTRTSLSPIWSGFAPCFVNYKKGALDSQPQAIKFTSCLPMVNGSLRAVQLLPPLKLVDMLYKHSWNIAESGVKHKKKSITI